MVRTTWQLLTKRVENQNVFGGGTFVLSYHYSKLVVRHHKSARSIRLNSHVVWDESKQLTGAVVERIDVAVAEPAC